MSILQLLQETLFNPTLNYGAWAMVILVPIIFIASILFPLLMGKKGTILSSLGSLLPLVIAVPTLMWANFIFQSAIPNSPANFLESDIFSGISVMLTIIYLGAKLSLFMLLTTAIFTAVFRKSRGKAVIIPILLMVITGITGSWAKQNVLRYDVLSNYGVKIDGVPRSSFLESIFISKESQLRIEEQKKYSSYALRFSLSTQTLYSSISERTEQITESDSLSSMIKDHINEFYEKQTQLLSRGLINSFPKKQTILLEYSEECEPVTIDSSVKATLINLGFTNLETRQKGNITVSDLRE